jgi:hypothetical protein
LLGGALPDSVNELIRGIDANVRRDKQFFELIPDLCADSSAVEEGHGSAEPGIVGTLEGFLKDIDGSTSVISIRYSFFIFFRRTGFMMKLIRFYSFL